MLRQPAFSPSGDTVNLTAQQPNLPLARAKFDALLSGAKSRKVRLYNAGPSLAFVALVGQDASGQPVGTVSTDKGMPLSVDREIILETNGSTSFAAVTAQGTATIYATPGEGGI